MPSASNAAIAYLNLADEGIITASSSTSLSPPSILQNPHVVRKWRAVGNNEALVVDLGSQHSIDTVALMGVNLTAAGTSRLRVSTADTSGQDGNAYNGASAAGRVDPKYGRLILMAPAPVTGRYVRVDIADTSLSYVEAGRLFVGLRNQFRCNYSSGWSKLWQDRSRRVQSRGGQTYVDPDNMVSEIQVAFNWISESERYTFVDDLDRLNGGHTDVLLMLNPTSSNLGRDSIWGLPSETSPVVHVPGFDGNEQIFSKTYKITERL